MEHLLDQLASTGPLGVVAVLAIWTCGQLYRQLIACQEKRVTDIERVVTVVHTLTEGLNQNTEVMRDTLKELRDRSRG